MDLMTLVGAWGARQDTLLCYPENTIELIREEAEGQ